MSKQLFFCLLLVGLAAGSKAQVFQVFQKDGASTKFQATEVDSLSHDDSAGATTLYFKNGSREVFPKEETDSVVFYYPDNSILNTLQKKGNYSNFLRLIHENKLWTDNLNGASDITVFAANDAGWQHFFAENSKLPSTNPWHKATSYDSLTDDQKRLLLSAAITSPIKIEEMASKRDSIDFIGYKIRVHNVAGMEEVWTPIISPAFCYTRDITKEDQQIIFGTEITAPWTPNNSFIEIDKVCNNGYLEQVSVPLTPLGTMEDLIRTNGRTNIFSQILDCLLPYLNDDSYYGAQLKFNPGWAGYYNELGSPERDMAAMFVPSDKSLWNYFTQGAGQTFLTSKPATQEELVQQLKSIPAELLVSLINDGMMWSFMNSVPSKWNKLFNSAQEPLFENHIEAMNRLDTCLIANNGAIYVIDQMIAPSDFLSATAPMYLSNTCQIIKSAVFSERFGAGYMGGMNFDAYLKAPQQNITFFMPTDSALFYYYDPISMKSRTPRVIEFSYAGGAFPVKMRFRNYYGPYNSGSNEPGSIGSVIPGANSYSNDELIDRLKDILLNHTIVSDETQNINSRNEYYRTMGGDVVKVIRNAEGKIISAQGTFQIENERQGIISNNPGVTDCLVRASYESLSNGQTYALNAPLVPTYRSLYSLIGNNDNWTDSNPYSEFLKLCLVDEELIFNCGLIDKNLSSTERREALKQYNIFVDDNGLDYNLTLLSGNTPYTAYIPTNEAVRQAIAQGLPTWESIYEDFSSHRSGETFQSYEDSLRVISEISLLMDVIKSHFHYGMAIADKEPFRGEFKTIAIDRENLVPHKVNVSIEDGNLSVTDWEGSTFHVTENKNIFVRDYSCSKSPISVVMRGITVNGCRSGVVHQIDGVLGFTK